MAKADQSIPTLEKQLQQQKKRLDQLKRERVTLAEKLSKLDAEISQLEGKQPPSRGAKKARVKKPRRARSESLDQYVQSVLSEADKSLTAKEVADKVIEKGYTTKSKSFASTVSQHLAKSPLTRRVRRGRYTLKKSAGTST